MRENLSAGESRGDSINPQIDAQPLEEVGELFHVTKERMGQLNEDAVSKLRDSSRDRKLREYLV